MDTHPPDTFSVTREWLEANSIYKVNWTPTQRECLAVPPNFPRSLSSALIGKPIPIEKARMFEQITANQRREMESRNRVKLDSRAEDEGFAMQLFGILKKANRIAALPNIVAWGNTFRRLKKTVTSQQITEALDWFEQNIDRKGTRRIRSADAFCQIFDKIQVVIGRLNQSTEKKGQLLTLSDVSYRFMASSSN